jgi:hypothetical protein
MAAVREKNVALIWPGLLSQQGAANTAVRIVTVHTLSFYGLLVRLRLRGFLVKAGLRLSRSQKTPRLKRETRGTRRSSISGAVWIG